MQNDEKIASFKSSDFAKGKLNWLGQLQQNMEQSDIK